MFEKLKYKLYKGTGISTEYVDIRHKQEQMNKNHQNYEHFLLSVNNAVDEMNSLLNEIEKNIKEDVCSSRIINGKESEIERVKHRIKITESDNDYKKYLLELHVLEENFRSSFQSFVSSTFNNLKNGTANNSFLVNNFRTFLTYLKIVIDNEAYTEFSDRSSFETITKLINRADLDYREIENLKNHLLTVQSRVRMNLSKSSNDMYAFNNSDKVRIYDALDEKKRR